MNNLSLFNNVNKRYENKITISNYSFSINEYEFLSLIGNNGCGKSTTIHILCNLLPYDSGEVLFDGKKVTPNYVSYKKHLGIVLSKPYYVEEFNVVEYWKFVCKFQEVPKNEINQRIDDLVNLLELNEHTKKPIKNLSSGNQMKVSLGGALIHNPKMLVLDEPFVNLDIGTTEKIMQILKGFKGKKTLFITSHQLELVADLCDRFLIMDKGHIVAELNKQDYESLDALKTHVKQFLVKEDNTLNLSWLG
jgi:ABC-2 type transport system ATP-binding protein